MSNPATRRIIAHEDLELSVLLRQRTPLTSDDKSRIVRPRHIRAGKHKLDLEACAVVPGSESQLLMAFGSGLNRKRGWIAIIDWRNSEDPETSLHEAVEVYSTWRRNKGFCGCGLNIVAAIFVDEHTLRLFQRGNAEPQDALQPVDATADVSFSELMAHVKEPHTFPPPDLENIVTYVLGRLDGCRLTFSGAEKISGRVLYSASAVGNDRTAGSVLGIIDDGGARWAKITDEEGRVFQGKIEGLTSLPGEPDGVYFIIDEDDSARPSDLFQAELQGPWGLLRDAKVSRGKRAGRESHV